MQPDAARSKLNMVDKATRASGTRPVGAILSAHTNVTAYAYVHAQTYLLFSSLALGAGLGPAGRPWPDGGGAGDGSVVLAMVPLPFPFPGPWGWADGQRHGGYCWDTLRKENGKKEETNMKQKKDLQ